jgi:hypothetical protein
VFLHLDAQLNYHRLFNEALGDFRIETLAARQAAALHKVALDAAI